ncbi:MAG: hypothetical protein GQ527_03710, partial [Bacteroidales bacterium]|nr:hypothetical protein [Bacteroidales bacterium]
KSNSTFTREEDIYEDALQWYKMANRISDSSSLIIYGEEFGSGPAAWIAGNQQADLIVLDSPYYSWNKIMLRKYFWWLPHTYLTQYTIPVWEFIRKSTNRIVLVHATDSKNIKYSNSLDLLEFLKPGDELITIESSKIDQNSESFKNNMEKVLHQMQNP